MFTTEPVIAIVIAVCVGFLCGLLKDFLQQKLFIRNMRRLGELDAEEEMEKIIKASGFALNEHRAEEGEDSKNIEADYKGYFS